MSAIHVLNSPQDVGRAVAGRIADLIEAAGRRPFLLGCPGGRSPVTTYTALGEIAARRGLDLSQLRIVMMDDYVQAEGSLYARVDHGAHYSCERFAREEIRETLNAQLPVDLRVDSAHIWLPDPKEPEAYDESIDQHGGVDFFILASGAGDGHVAFNPPGTPASARTRVVELAEQTRRDNLVTFPQFADIDEVPTHGVTVGVGTIAELSHEAALVIHGADKRTAFNRLTGTSKFDESWPATVVHLVQRSAIYADDLAADPHIISRSGA